MAPRIESDRAANGFAPGVRGPLLFDDRGLHSAPTGSVLVWLSCAGQTRRFAGDALGSGWDTQLCLDVLLATRGSIPKI
jgi:hypothetical protein